ncbi:MAG: hypothetical protein HY908_36050, partial [Myxococcales bacterium]|nr:hypothetical protein [Myxococcales bacterium]
SLPASAREDAERVLRDDLTRAGLRPRLEQLLAHGLMVAAARRATRGAERRIRFADRLAFWSSSPDEAAAEDLEARERWHRAVLDAQRDAVLNTLGSITWNHPELAYQRSLRAAHAWLEAVSTYGGNMAPDICPVHHRIEVLQALDATLAQLGRCFGLQGQLGDLAGAVLAHLRSTPPPRAAPPPPGPRRLAWDQVVLLVAETLRPTDFVARDHAIAAAAAARAEASADAAVAAATVTFWDKVNVFTKSPAERRRDAKSAEATTEAGRLAAMMTQATGLLFDAMRAYPPAALYYGLIEARAAVAAIRAERRTHTTTTGTGSSRTTTTHHTCVLVGKEAALRRLRGWTRDMVRALGVTPTDTELCERWVATALA